MKHETEGLCELSSDAALPKEERVAAYRHQRRLARECAVQFLYQTDQQQGWDDADAELAVFWARIGEMREDLDAELLAEARPFAERLIRGVLGVRAALDEQIGACALNWRLERMSVVDRNILRLAAYQLLHCEDVPNVTAVDEAVELAKVFGQQNSGGFINGVLDSLLRKVSDES